MNSKVSGSFIGVVGMIVCMSIWALPGLAIATPLSSQTGGIGDFQLENDNGWPEERNPEDNPYHLGPYEPWTPTKWCPSSYTCQCIRGICQSKCDPWDSNQCICNAQVQYCSNAAECNGNQTQPCYYASTGSLIYVVLGLLCLIHAIIINNHR